MAEAPQRDCSTQATQRRRKIADRVKHLIATDSKMVRLRAELRAREAELQRVVHAQVRKEELAQFKRAAKSAGMPI